MQKTGVAVIGCGAISKMHFDSILNAKNTNLLYAVDTDKERAEDAAAAYGCGFHTDYREVLKDPSVHVVHLCTPHYLHCQMALEAMESGKHVLTEKPMAILQEDAEKMILKSEETGLTLGVCFQNRYNATSVKIREILRSGKAGSILGAKAAVIWSRDEGYYKSESWRGTWEMEGGGVLINQAIHTLDLLQYFVGNAVSVRGSYFSSLLEKAIEVEDTAQAVIKFDNGVNALFQATNCYCVNSPVSIEIICTKAIIKLDGDLTIQYSDGKTEVFTDDNIVTGEKSYWGYSHKLLMQDFYHCIQSGKKFALNGYQGIKALKIVNAIYKSSDMGQWVTV
jgi:predicted dehydrogenase